MTAHLRPLLLLALFACNPDGRGGGGAVSDDGGSVSSDGGASGDAGSTGDGGNQGSGEAPLDVTAELAENVSTVIRVSWRTEGVTTGHVEYGETDAHGFSTPTTDPGTDHEMLVLGMPPDTDVHFEVFVEGESGSATSGDLEITTGSLPSGLPTLAATGTADQWTWQVLPFQGTAFAVLIVDAQGRTVWYRETESGGNLMRAGLTADRQSVYYVYAGSQTDLESGKVVWAPLDGSDVRELPLPNIDHDATELPDGTIAAIVVDPRTRGDGSPWSADSIVELSSDGTLTEIWNAWDALDPTGYDLDREANWTHANGLDYSPEEDCYYLALKAPGSIAKIDRATGETLWLLNGRMNEFAFPDGVEIVQLQHQFDVLGDGGIVIFDNGTPQRGYSRVVELQLDEDALEADQVWEYIRDPSVFVFAKGDVKRFDDGTTQVVWSSSGEIQIVDDAGTVQWQANTDLGQAITFVQPFDDFYDAP